MNKKIYKVKTATYSNFSPTVKLNVVCKYSLNSSLVWWKIAFIEGIPLEIKGKNRDSV